MQNNSLNPKKISEIIEVVDTLKGEMVLIIEGNKEEQSIDDTQIIARIDYFVKLGLSQKDAINVVAEEFNINKNYVKKLVF